MHIFVQTGLHSFDRTQTLEVDPSDTILSVKQKIRGRGTFPLEQMRLSFKGQSLENTKTLADYDVQEKSTIQFDRSFVKCHALDEDQCSEVGEECLWYQPTWSNGKGGFCARDEKTTGSKITSICRNLSALDPEITRGLMEDLADYGVFTTSQRQRFDQMTGSQKCTMLSQGLLSHMFLRQFGSTPREVANRIEQLRGTWKQRLLGGRLVAEVKTVDQYRKDIDELLRLTRQELGVTKDSDALPGAIELVQKMTDPSGASIGKKWWFGAGGVALGTAAFLYYVFGTEQGGQMLDSMKAAVGYGNTQESTNSKPASNGLKADDKPTNSTKSPSGASETTSQNLPKNSTKENESSGSSSGNGVLAESGASLASTLVQIVSGVVLTSIVTFVVYYWFTRDSAKRAAENVPENTDDAVGKLSSLKWLFDRAVGGIQWTIEGLKNRLPQFLYSIIERPLLAFKAAFVIMFGKSVAKIKVLWNRVPDFRSFAPLQRLWKSTDQDIQEQKNDLDKTVLTQGQAISQSIDTTISLVSEGTLDTKSNVPPPSPEEVPLSEPQQVQIEQNIAHAFQLPGRIDNRNQRNVISQTAATMTDALPPNDDDDDPRPGWKKKGEKWMYTLLLWTTIASAAYFYGSSMNKETIKRVLQTYGRIAGSAEGKDLDTASDFVYQNLSKSST